MGVVVFGENTQGMTMRARVHRGPRTKAALKQISREQGAERGRTSTSTVLTKKSGREKS